MYHCVTNPDKKKYKGIFLGVALTSFITGITEPCEFMFLFVCPPLYVVHSLLDGLSFFVADVLNISIGNTFSGGVIDFLLFGVLQGNRYTYRLASSGQSFITLCSALPSPSSILPLRAVAMMRTRKAKSSSIPSPLCMKTRWLFWKRWAGRENIEDVDACITRLRVAVKDSAKVDKELLKKVGATAVLDVQGGIQAIYGAKAILYKNEINDILGVAD